MKFLKNVFSQRVTNFALAGLMVLSMVTAFGPFIFSQSAFAAPGITTTNSGFGGLTDWQDDRRAPSGGLTLTNSQLTLNVDGDNGVSDPFYRTEGRSAALPAGTNSIKATLDVDSAWESVIGVRAGIWGVTAAPSVYPILEFSNRNEADVQQPGTAVIRAWDDATDGWTTLVSNPVYGQSYTFEIVHNAAADTFDFYINNASTPARSVSTVYNGTSHGPLTRVIFNSFNAALPGNDYSVNWTNFQTGSYSPAAPSNLKFINDSTSTEVAVGSTVNYTDLTLQWDIVPNAERYQIKVTDPDGISQQDRYTGWYTFDLNDATRYGLFGTKQGVWTYEVRTKDATTGLWSEFTTPLSLIYDNTKPTVLLTNPSSPLFNNSTDLVIQATDNIALNKVVANVYKVGVAGVFKPTQATTSASTYNHTVDLAGFVDGDYYVKFNAVDKAGNVSTTTTYNFTIDNIAPGVPTGFTPIDGSFTNNPDFSMTWDTVAGATVYEYQTSYTKVDATTLGGIIDADSSATASNYTLGASTITRGNSGAPEATYYWQVRAGDAAGNWSAWSAVNGVTVDTSAPIVNLVAPLDGAIVKGTIAVTGTATDVFGLSHYNLSLYNGTVDLSDGGTHTADRIATTGWVTTGQTNVTGTLANIARNLDTTGLASGDYQIRLAARDAAGNLSTTDSVTYVGITVDNEAPDVAITAPADSAIINTTTSQPIDIRGTVTDAHPHHYYIKIERQTGPSAWTTTYSATVNDSASFTDQSIYSWTPATDGTYRITLEARDAAGGTASSGNKDAGSVDSITVTVDTDAPDVTITAPADLSTFGDDALVPITGTIGDAVSYELFIDGVSVETGSSFTGYDWDTAGLASGDYLIKLVAKDAANNENSSEITVTLDNTDPALTIAAVTTEGNTPTISGTAEADATLSATFNGTTFPLTNTAGAWSFTSAALANGTYAFSITATDTFGNETTQTASVVVAVIAPSTTSTTTVTPATPLITSLASFAAAAGDVAGATTDTPAVEGATDDKAAALDTDASDGSIYGLAWYWWLLIIAALAAIAGWIIAAIRRRNSEA